MALVKCPECGREKVSDSAESCPNCGYAIKVYYDKLRQEEEKKRLEEEKQKQIIAAEEERKRLQEEREKKRKEIVSKYFGSPTKKIAWGVVICVVLALIIMLGIYVSKENQITKAIENSKLDVDGIESYASSIDSTLSSADFVYGTFESKSAVDNITDELSCINQNITWIDDNYKKDVRVSNAIESYVKSETSYASWEEYKQYLSDKYFVGSTNEESADILVKKVAYSTSEEKREAERQTSLIVEDFNLATSGDHYKIYGTVTNNTSYTVYFVKVKASLLDAEHKVIDSETAYACGDEGIEPGESTKFNCFIEKDPDMKYYRAEIYEYD